MHVSAVAWKRGRWPGPPNNFDWQFNLVSCRALHAALRFDEASKLFIYGFNKEKLLKINALRRLKMLLQRPPDTLAARAFGALDWPLQQI